MSAVYVSAGLIGFLFLVICILKIVQEVSEEDRKQKELNAILNGIEAAGRKVKR